MHRPKHHDPASAQNVLGPFSKNTVMNAHNQWSKCLNNSMIASHPPCTDNSANPFFFHKISSYLKPVFLYRKTRLKMNLSPESFVLGKVTVGLLPTFPLQRVQNWFFLRSSWNNECHTFERMIFTVCTASNAQLIYCTFFGPTTRLYASVPPRNSFQQSLHVID